MLHHSIYCIFIVVFSMFFSVFFLSYNIFANYLFARAFYQASRDVVKLADVLGHSSIETTRIYLLSTGAEHARQLARLGLIS